VVLYTSDVTKPFNLYFDSGDCAVGAVLTQQVNCGFERPISFISQKLTETQQRWATIEESLCYCLGFDQIKESYYWCKDSHFY